MEFHDSATSQLAESQNFRQASLPHPDCSPCRAGLDDSEVFHGEPEPEAAPAGKALSCPWGADPVHFP